MAGCCCVRAVSPPSKQQQTTTDNHTVASLPHSHKHNKQGRVLCLTTENAHQACENESQGFDIDRLWVVPPSSEREPQLLGTEFGLVWFAGCLPND